ncbi:type I polyketide synthase [Streptomyces sp. NPDC050610]|uniref:type I polyketide synthase n=1 Tax=Streptomyces sp. NPDC050610 TaxID=3157097 RepID=UPI003440A8DB
MVHGTGSGSPLLWMLSGSGSGRESLAARARRLREHLRGREDWRPADIGLALAGTALTGRRHAALVADDRTGFLDLLEALADGRGAPGLAEVEGGGGRAGRGTAFVYPGQGAQWPGMAARLLETSPVFRRRMDDCAQALETFTDWSLIDLLRGAPDAPDLGRADVVQPVLFAMTLSLTELWRSYGVEPGAVLGHSVGEITSAAVADALSLDDAARVVALWSQAQATLAGRGEMVSVMAAAEELAPRLERWSGRLVVAAVNGPRSAIVSGDADAAEELLTDLARAGVHARKVAVGLAAHSAHIDEIIPRMRTDLAPIRPRPARLPYYSALTGGLLETPVLDADYWCRNLRGRVDFASATRALLADGYGTLLEVSPHTVLTSAMQGSAEESGADAHVMGTLRREQGDLKRFLTSLGELYAHGVAPDWQAVYAGHDARAAELPRHLGEPASEELDGEGPDGEGPGGEGTNRARVAVDAPGSGLRAELAALPAAGRRAALLKLIGREVAGLMGRTGPVPADQPFLDLGFDSVTAVELRNRLSAATGLRVPATAVFDHPTPGALAEALRVELDGDHAGVADAAAEAAELTTLGASDEDDPVVIVGMACRYPGGAGTPDELWQLVSDGADAVTPFPTDRDWDTAAHYDPEPGQPGRYYQREAGFLHDAAEFDARFFGISPREALAMDPQQRLLLETAWESFERAGIDPATLRGSRTGVFVGAMTMDYGPRLQDGGEVGGHLLTGNTGSVASGRLAYTLGLEGAAITVDTACSSSLVALHLAARAISSGECAMALAGGATVMSTVGMFVEFSRQGGLAPDGRCKAFAADADGFGLAEGVGMLLLERLSDARRSGHPVLAVVRGSAVNQDGASNGLTAPNGPSQQRVIRAALADSGLRAADVDLVEAHGTGTRLGDPIEAQALLATYGQNRSPERPLMLGSLKSNIGHTQAAAGVGGVIKAVLAMRHAVMPKTLHVDGPTPEVDWSAGAVELLTESRPWDSWNSLNSLNSLNSREESAGRPRRAGVSSFGVSGTNAHVILEEAPPEPDEIAADETVPDETASDEAVLGAERDGAPCGASTLAWTLSAKSEQALRDQAHRLLEAQAGLSVADVGYSLATGRAAHQHRAVLVGADAHDFRQGLNALAAGSGVPGLVQGTVAASGEVAFVFPGQGSQWVGMAAELLDVEPVFAARVAECELALSSFVDWSLEDVLRARAGAPSLERVDVVQPVLFAVMVSLAAVWRSYGVEPAAVVGHSQGEIAAACVAGALSLDDAARVVALRSKALRALSGRGGMVSVALPAAEVGEWLADWDGKLSVAAVNGPASTVVSGDAGALDELLERAEVREVRARRVPVDYASHSSHVEDIHDQLLLELADVMPQQTDVPFYSTVTGELLESTTVLDAEYWYRNLRQTVRFEEATRALLAEGFRFFVEPSAHPVLAVGVQESAEAAGVEAVVLGTLRRDDGGRDRLLLSLGQAWASGLPVDFSGTYPGARRVDLPTYPFQRERFWLSSASSSSAPASASVSASAASADDLFEGLERQDPAQLSKTLGVSLEALGEVLPALSAWRSVQTRERRADSWRYHVGWRPVPVPPGAPLAGRWLAVVPELPGAPASDAVAGVLDALTGVGVELTLVTAAGPGATREELSAALTEAARTGPGPADVSATNAAAPAGASPADVPPTDAPPADAPDTPDAPDERPIAGVLSLLAWEERPHPELPELPGALSLTLALAQALGDAGIDAPLWLLTHGTAVVGGAERPGAPAHAAVAALGRTVALEHPQRWGGLADLPAALDERAALRLCAVLAGAAAGEEQVAVRSTGVHGRRLLAAPPRPYATGGRWERGGTALVTGGTGGVGSYTARRLAAQGAERLLLASRRGAEAPGAEELRAELAELGVAVDIAACDIADREALAALVEGIPADAPLTGVFHAAGVLDDGLLDALTPGRLAVSLRAKLTAAQNLHEVTAHLDLSAFVVFSSVMGVVGNAGQGNYAAANAAMDALIALRRADGLPGTSIAWGAWAVAGMLDDEVAARLRDFGMPVMDPESAVTAIDRAVAEDDGLVLVADVDWRRFAEGTGLRSSALLAELPDPGAETGAPEAAVGAAPGGRDVTGGGSVRARLVAPASAEDRIQCATDLVRTHTAAVLRHRTADAVRPAEAFAALGLDSLTAVELRNRLGVATGLKLPATVVFDHPTPSALAERIISELAALGELSGTDAAARSKPGPVAKDGTAPERPYHDDPVVIVGMGCRFPGNVERPEDFWALLADGIDAVGDWPLDRGWDAEGLYDPDPDHPGTTYSDQGAFIADAGGFDAEFFGISPREALAMDPQQRLLLETSWEAIEGAGQDPTALRGRQVGVYFGTNGQDYLAQLEGAPGASEGHFLTGNTASVLSGRVSYVLGLEGPALTLDTACSSSLVALHLAVQALRRGDCEQALAGGVTVMSTPKLFVEFSRQRGLAPDGRCKAFSADADGTGWGEGAGVLLLERLSAARRHGHPVLAVVSGTAVNQDGASNGLSAPNGPAQQNVIRAALVDAGLRPEEVDAVEAHGTGTRLGDPIEAQALQAVYGARRPADRPLWLGSVKSNIGHTQAAAGVAGVMKMVLAIRNGELPSTLHLGDPNPHVDWSAGGIRLLAQRTPWPESGGTRRAGVSSFGISGTNVHVVLEQAPAGTGDSAPARSLGGSSGSSLHEDADADAAATAAEGGDRPAPRPLPVPLLLSAATPQALRAQAACLHAHLADRPDADLADVAYSLASGRAALEHRAAVLGTEPESVLRSLRAYADGGRPASVLTGSAGLPGRTAFLFPGQGSQRAGAGAQLYRRDPVFADALDEVLTELDPHLEVPLRDVLFAEDGMPEAELLERTRYTQPALFALETALFRLVRHWGVRPDLLMGHSIGEVAAAHAAGVLDLRDACALVAARGRLMDALPEGGAMAAIEAEEAEVRETIAAGSSSDLAPADIAAVNGPDSTVVSGDAEAVLRLAEEFRSRGRRTKRLAVSHAFHSARMDGMLDEFRRVAEGLTYSAPRIAVVSNLTGEPAAAEELCSPDYWVRHVRGTVRFLDGARRLRAEGATTFLELGPGGVLSGMLHGCLEHADGCETLPMLREGRPETAAVRGALAGLHVRGVPVDWPTGWRGMDVRRVTLPTYAFQRKRFWPEPAPAPTAAGTAPDELWNLLDGLDGPDGVRAFAAELGLDEGAALEDVPRALASRRSRRAADAAADRLRYRVGWQPLPAPADATRLSGTWLLVTPADGPGGTEHALACEHALARHGAEVTVLRVAAGTGRAELAGLLPTDKAADITGVLSLLAFADDGRPDPNPDPDPGAPSAALAATLLLIQALGDREVIAPLWCVTSGAVTLDGAATPDGTPAPYEPPPVNPVQAQLWGLGRVAALEHPDRWGGLADLPGALNDAALDGLCAVLAVLDGEDQVAVRAVGLFGRRLDRAPVPAGPAAERWKPRGTVLVTGGTGGLGAHVARRLAADGAEHLVLLSRRGPRSPGAAELAAELSALGARSTVLACDVADRAELTRVVEGLRAEHETVRAVVHTAGLTSDTRIEHCTLDDVVRETAAKTRGADNLDALFDGPSLDAFVLFSSISATWGSGGQAAYAAANAHLDALAAARRARGLAATSVAWGPWSGAGMAHGDVGRQLRRHGLVPMEPAAALAALQRALTFGESELVVADMDWQSFTPTFLSARPSALLRRLPDAAPADDRPEDRTEGPGSDAHDVWRRELAELPETERGHRLRELVRAEAAEVLGHDTTGSIAADRPFRDAGFDSLTAVELRNRLIAATGLPLPLTTVFDHPTATALGDHLLAELTGAAPPLHVPTTSPVLSTPPAPAGEPLAIVSMACRFPGGVRSPEDLWRLVTDGVDAIGDLPADRGWPLAELYDPDPERQGTFYATGGGFLDGAGEFDAEFFGVSPREALAMDPQQRLLLETGWEALERAGIDPASVRGDQGGVYVGVASQGYGTGPHDPAADVEGHLLSGTVTSVASGRISYTLGLEGPAVTVETACSSSLVALHLAGQALRSGDCSFALVGGAAVMASPDVFVEFSRQQGLSPDGRCRSFAQSANGTGWGEGVGVLLVERLSDARRLGHPVLALVRGTAVNQDGASNGLTAPSGPAQQRAINAALAGAGLSGSQIDLVEAHGTGTTLGDPIEAQALLATYGQERPAERPLWLGSLKSNIGHTQAAAGVAGVIKTVMALRHGVLPRTLHAEEASSRVDWSAGAVRLLAESRPWDAGDQPRRAGVSAFGMSGTNAHAVLEQAPEAAPVARDAAVPVLDGAAVPVPLPHGGALPASRVDAAASALDAGHTVTPAPALPAAVPWLLSARTPGALRRQARQLLARVEADPDVRPAELARALATTRTAFPCRAASVGAGREELLDWLGALAEGAPATGAVQGRRSRGGRTAFVFPGQGSQWAGMASQLLGDEPVFTDSIERCAEALAPYTDWSLTQVLRNDPDAPSLDRVDVVQPTLFAVMVALAEYWRAIGVRPDAVIGHSQGEIAAACIAGALSLQDAAMVVALRSKALLRLAGRGGMVSVAAPEERVRGLLSDGDGSCVAAVNGPEAVVVAGEPDGLAALLAACVQHGLRARRIPVDYAAHSDQVAEIKGELLTKLAPVCPRSCVVPLYSAVTGGPIEGSLLNADYWYRNLREPVDFAGATRALLAAGHDLLIEVSPHPVLLAAAERVAEESGRAMAGVGTLRRDDGGRDRLLASSAEAWAAGAPVDRAALLPEAGEDDEGAEARPVPLPTYPFQRDRYWLPTPGRSGISAAPEPVPADPSAASAPSASSTPSASAAKTAEAPQASPAVKASPADRAAGLAAAPSTSVPSAAVPSTSAPSPEHASAADEEEPPAARLAARLASLDGPGRRQAVLDLVTRHAAAVLGHPGAGAVPPDRAFSEVGFDSMLAMRFRSQLCTATGLSIPPTVVFEHPTPAALADHLHDELSAVAAPAPARLTELDDLAAKLAALTPGAPGTEGIGDRLNDLLREWTRRVGPAAGPGGSGGGPLETAAGHPADETATASADELFALLDDNFGMA